MTPSSQIPNHAAIGAAIGIAGTGSMAQAVGALLRQKGITVAAVAGRRVSAAERAAAFIGASSDRTPSAVSIRELPAHAGCILIAVSDDAVAEVARELASSGLRDAIVLHTSGAAGPDALAALRLSGCSVGVLHPLQTVPAPGRGVATLPGATFAYAGDSDACAWAQDLIRALDGSALTVEAEHWSEYHAAAVMACNYHVTLVDCALELMERAGIARGPALKALAPLIRATTENVLRCGPEAALTGPIRRGDAATIERHVAALKAASAETERLYTTAGVRTLSVALRAGLAPDKLREISAVLLGNSRTQKAARDDS